MPPLRENCGMPFWFATCACLQAVHGTQQNNNNSKNNNNRGREHLLFVLSCTGFLLSWQFACFALLLQALSLYALVVMGVADGSFAVEVSRLYAGSALLSSALRFGDLWAVRSPFFWVVGSVGLAGWPDSRQGPTRALAAAALLLCYAAALRAAVGWMLVVQGGGDAEDNAHIVEFLSFRLQDLLRQLLGSSWVQSPTPLSYHAALYYGQRSFNSPTCKDLLDSGPLLLAALLAAVAVLCALLPVLCAPRTAESLAARRQLFPHAFLLMLVLATAPLFGLMLRYRIFLFPHLALLGSLLLDGALLPGRCWHHLGRCRGPIAAVMLASLLAADGSGIRRSLAGFRLWDAGSDQTFPGQKEDEVELGALMQWLVRHSAEEDVVISGMGLSALVRLHAARGVVCHPHYESAQLRERCFWAEKLNGHRTPSEYHAIIAERLFPGLGSSRRLGSGRAFVAVSVKDCFSSNELGQSMSAIIEQHVLPEATSVGRKLDLQPVASCAYARYLLQEAGDTQGAAALFKDLHTKGFAEQLGAFGPPLGIHRAHLRALELRPDRRTGAFGCCELGRKFLGLSSAAARLMREGMDPLAAERYYREAAALTPESARSNGFLGFARLQAGNFVAALQSFQKASELEEEENSATSTTQCGKAMALGGLGRFQEASEALRLAGALNPRELCLTTNAGLLDAAFRPSLAVPTVDDLGRSPANNNTNNNNYNYNKNKNKNKNNNNNDNDNQNNDNNNPSAEVVSYGELQEAWESYKGGVAGWKQFLEHPAVRRAVRKPLGAAADNNKDNNKQKILFLGRSGSHVAPVLQSLSVLRQAHGAWLPLAGGVLDTGFGAGSLRGALGAELRAVPSPQGSWPLQHPFWKWRANFSLQSGQHPQSYSSECLFLDADNLALQPPQDLLPTLRASQESGQLMVRSSWILLIFSTLRICKVFLEAMYSLDDGSGLMCGYGDKLRQQPWLSLSSARPSREEFGGFASLRAGGGSGLCSGWPQVHHIYSGVAGVSRVHWLAWLGQESTPTDDPEAEAYSEYRGSSEAQGRPPMTFEEWKSSATPVDPTMADVSMDFEEFREYQGGQPPRKWVLWKSRSHSGPTLRRPKESTDETWDAYEEYVEGKTPLSWEQWMAREVRAGPTLSRPVDVAEAAWEPYQEHCQRSREEAKVPMSWQQWADRVHAARPRLIPHPGASDEQREAYEEYLRGTLPMNWVLWKSRGHPEGPTLTPPEAASGQQWQDYERYLEQQTPMDWEEWTRLWRASSDERLSHLELADQDLETYEEYVGGEVPSRWVLWKSPDHAGPTHRRPADAAPGQWQAYEEYVEGKTPLSFEQWSGHGQSAGPTLECPQDVPDEQWQSYQKHVQLSGEEGNTPMSFQQWKGCSHAAGSTLKQAFHSEDQREHAKSQQLEAFQSYADGKTPMVWVLWKSRGHAAGPTLTRPTQASAQQWEAYQSYLTARSPMSFSQWTDRGHSAGPTLKRPAEAGELQWNAYQAYVHRSMPASWGQWQKDQVAGPKMHHPTEAQKHHRPSHATEPEQEAYASYKKWEEEEGRSPMAWEAWTGRRLEQATYERPQDVSDKDWAAYEKYRQWTQEEGHVPMSWSTWKSKA
ncbi:unnamed protein product [Polarella glacialis]|uniref:Dolichyl-phosphate-mannose--protein mannosyltransferase n=1 Tax=Polarella glacialis TaxID=89957 RepID=A0A813F385_POLGL|nr:unnamed protein product [Polarella glacialis]